MPQDNQLTRLRVNMNMKTAKQLLELMRAKGMTATEMVRRAIALYKFLKNEQANDRVIVICKPHGGRDKIMHLK